MNNPSACYVQTVAEDNMQRHLQALQTRTALALLFHVHGNDLSTVTVHQVQAKSKGNQIMPGRPLSPEDEQTILDLLVRPDGGAAGKQILPANVLATDRFSTLWWVPGAVRDMHLRPTSGAAKVVKVMWPNLVMLAQHQSLYLCAIEASSRPERSTKVYHAPLGNVFASTQVCLGAVTTPLGCSVEDIEGWNRVCFDSAFSHLNHQNVMREGRKFIDPMNYWSKPRKRPLAVEQLSTLKMNLGQWWDSIASGAMGAD